MAVVKVVNEKYIVKDSIRNLINYATKFEETKGRYFGAIGTNAQSPDLMIQQMIKVKNGFEKIEGRQLRHIVVSFDSNEKVTADMAYFIAYDIAAYYANKYQICFGVHTSTDNIHIHFVQNTVSYVDGRLFSGGQKELAEFKQHVNDVIDRYICTKKELLEKFFGQEY